MPFRSSFYALCAASLMSIVTAQEAAQLSSPNGQFSIQFHGPNPSLPNSFTLLSASQKVLFDSKSCPKLANIAEFSPDHVLWCPDSQTVAIAGGYSKFLTTYLFTRQGDAFINTPVPYVADDYDNPYIFPLKWIKGRRLILSISGPHAGRAFGHYYRGRATVLAPRDGGTCEVHYQYISQYDESPSD